MGLGRHDLTFGGATARIPQRKAQARYFGNLLVKCGIDAHLDQWEAPERKDWYLWAIHQIQKADFVLILASPTCKAVGDGTVESGRNLGMQSDALGLRGVLDIVLAQREFARSLLPQCPDTLRPQLLSTLGYASRLAGWFSFNLNDFSSATFYYDDARAQAHEAGNIELVALVLAQMSGAATRGGTPRLGIDHAVASCEWASRTDDRGPTLGGHCWSSWSKPWTAAGMWPPPER